MEALRLRKRRSRVRTNKLLMRECLYCPSSKRMMLDSMSLMGLLLPGQCLIYRPQLSVLESWPCPLL
ncbi:hypothetical protein CsSME_00005318 [Camellia sinensis var. sinensis]